MISAHKIAKTALAAQAIRMANREESLAAVCEMDGENAATFIHDSKAWLEHLALRELHDYGWRFGLRFPASLLARARACFALANDGFYPKDRSPKASADDLALMATTHRIDDTEYAIFFDENEYAYGLVNLTGNRLEGTGYSTAWDAMMSLAMENQDLEKKLENCLSDVCMLENQARGKSANHEQF